MVMFKACKICGYLTIAAHKPVRSASAYAGSWLSNAQHSPVEWDERQMDERMPGGVKE
jgi:hypothetical protein